MANDMVSPDDVAYLPGAPFTEAEVDAAVAELRTEAGWHIAPVHVDTGIALDVVCWEPTLRLPTRKLVSLDEVRNADSGAVIAASRYRVSHGFCRVRLKCGFWPDGYEAVEVDMTHGFEEAPKDLLPVVAELIREQRRDGAVQTVRVDDASVTYGGSSTSSPTVGYLSRSAVVRRYVLPEWTGMA